MFSRLFGQLAKSQNVSWLGLILASISLRHSVSVKGNKRSINESVIPCQVQWLDMKITNKYEQRDAWSIPQALLLWATRVYEWYASYAGNTERKSMRISLYTIHVTHWFNAFTATPQWRQLVYGRNANRKIKKKKKNINKWGEYKFKHSPLLKIHPS